MTKKIVQKIKSLVGVPKTDEEIAFDDARIKECEELAVARHRRTDPMDRDLARTAVMAIVALDGDPVDLNEDHQFYFVSGPREMQAASNVLKKHGTVDQDKFASLLKEEVPKITESGSLGIDYDDSTWVAWSYYYDYGLTHYVPEERKDHEDFSKYFKEVTEKNAFFGVYEGDGYFILMDFPEELHWSEDDQLHSETGPAVSFRDGSHAYYLNGTQVPGWVFKTPKEEVSSKRVLEIENTDVRSEVINYLGHCFLSNLEKNELDKGEIGGRKYTLYDQVKFDGESLGTFLEMEGPSTGKPYFERVGDDCKTIQSANAWADGDRHGFVEPSVLT